MTEPLAKACVWLSVVFMSACADTQPAAVSSVGPGSTVVSGMSSPVDAKLQEAQAMEQHVKKLAWTALPRLETWYADVQQVTDTTSLEAAFLRQGYDPGPDAYAFIAKIERRSNGEEVYRFYSYRDTAFVFSLTPEGEERFWPASTVKLTAAVMALMRAESIGVEADDPVTFTDLDEERHTTLRTLVEEAIIPSDNQAYNALMLFAGLDRANDTYIRETFHFPTMVLQRRYYRKAPEDNLRVSPEFVFEHGTEMIRVPSERSTHYFAHVPREANATTLVELAEILRRVMTGTWLTLSASNLSILRGALLAAPSCIGEGVERAHPGYKVYNKGGRVIGDDRLEVAYITDASGTPQYLLALSLPYSEQVEVLTQTFAWQLITAVDAQMAGMESEF